MRDLFGDCGVIKAVRIPKDRSTDMNRGFAFITFESEKSVRKSLNYDGHTFYKRKLKIGMADNKPEF